MATRVLISSLSLYDIDRLKRDLLFFDSVEVEWNVFARTSSVVSALLKYQYGESFAVELTKQKEAEIEFLQDRAVVRAINALSLFEMAVVQDDTNVNIHWNLDDFPADLKPSMNQEIKGILDEFASAHGAFGVADHKITIAGYADLTIQTKEIPNRRTQLLALYRNYKCSDDSIYTANTKATMLTGPPELQADVLQLLLPYFPQPAVDTPWERILEFRSNDESRQSLRALRRWIKKHCNSSLTTQELTEEIEYLVSEYERLYKLHEIQFTRSPVERLICNSVGIIEDIIKLRLGSAASRLFQLRKARTDFLIRLPKLDGYELRYLAEVRREFPANTQLSNDRNA